MKESQIVAIRGRNPDNPNDRTEGINLKQRLELNKDNILNCLTTVEKDNLVMETDIINPFIDCEDVGWHFAQNVYSEDSKCIRSVKSSSGSGNIPKVMNIKQATKEGSIPYEIGGGVRWGLP